MAAEPNVPGMAANGPATELIEATATSIGAGMLLGGFIAGLFAVASKADPAWRDEALIVWSSFAGLISVVVVVVEAILG